MKKPEIMTKFVIRNASSSQPSSFWFRHSYVISHSDFVILISSFLFRNLIMVIIDKLLAVIVDHGGSDLHIGEGQPPKMRKHGDIAPIGEKLLARDETMSMLREVCGERNWEIFEDRGDLD